MSYSDAKLIGMRYTEIADELVANATALNDEVSSLAKLWRAVRGVGGRRVWPRHLRGEEPWGDRVHPDALPSGPLLREVAGEAD
jgi:hypothetical protein